MNGWLKKLGLDRPELRAWAMYDWANSAMVCVIITAVFPIYYSRCRLRRRDEGRRGDAAGSPIVDHHRHGDHRRALARARDHGRFQRPQEGDARRLHAAGRRGLSPRCSSSTRATGSWPRSCSSWPTSGPTAASSSTTPSCPTSPATTRSTGSRRPAMRWATSAAGLLLALNLAWIIKPEWFGLPSDEGSHARRPRCRIRLAVPLGRRLVAGLLDPAVPPRAGADGRRIAARISRAIARSRSVAALDRLVETGRACGRYRQAVIMLLAFLIYNDGIGTIMRMATIYATELKIDQGCDDRVDPARAVRRHPVRLPLRHAGRPDRRQAVDRAGAGRLRGDLRRRLLHEDRRATS